eukprot:TRINITY_DN11896_c0_g1_i1.p1 TRINITY_DN11896_c0_g1~~TRINITY_DN11896_c0_g1_i1.p1  ORF type:complete len:127 (-),score=43.10 TRINITY_DN11896_c0_g1_i1:396-776(-)
MTNRWKAVFFVLNESQLCYYNDKQDTKLRGYIDVENAILEPGFDKKRKYVFRVIDHAAGSEIVVSAKSNKDMKMWMDAIRRTKNRLMFKKFKKRVQFEQQEAKQIYDVFYQFARKQKGKGEIRVIH